MCCVPLTLKCQQLHVPTHAHVPLQARRGGYAGMGDCLLKANDVENVTVCGGGPDTVLRMWREDYANVSRYNHSEGRHGVSLHGVTNFAIRDLTISDSGGDGVYIANSWRGPELNSRNVTVLRVSSLRNFRQGMSVIGVVGLAVSDSVLADTAGTPPSAGLDIEPNSPENSLQGDEPCMLLLLLRCAFGAHPLAYSCTR